MAGRRRAARPPPACGSASASASSSSSGTSSSSSSSEHDAGHGESDARADACTSAPGCTTQGELVCQNNRELGTCTKGSNGCFSLTDVTTCSVANGTGACSAGACVVGSCDATFQTCGGTQCQSVTDVAACGASCTACPAPPEHGTENCSNGTSCAFTCAAPYVVDTVNGVCSAPAPQLIAPLTGNIVSTRTPTLTWVVPTGFTSVHVEVCANSDPACSGPVWAQDVTGNSVSVGSSANLDGHLTFWRAFTIDTDTNLTRGTVPSFTWEFEGHGTTSAPISTSWWGFADVEGDGVADFIASTGSGVAEYQGAQGTGVSNGNVGGSFAGGGYLSGIGDFNGDGLTDVVTTGGVIAGSPGGLPAVLSYTAPALFQNPIALADINGDGFADVACTDEATTLWVFHGSASWLGATPAETITIPAGSTTFHILPIGDVNGDGYDDMLAMDSGYGSGVGRAYVYMGSSTGFSAPPHTLKNPGTYTDFGRVATRLGDVNGDGYADVAIVATQNSNVDLYIYYGSASGLTTPLVTVTDGTNIGSAGTPGIVEDGDFDGDGYQDALVLETYATALVLFGGPNGITAPSGTITSRTATLAHSGSVIGVPCNLSDLNDDGISDFGIQNISPDWGPTLIYYGSAGTFPTTSATSITLGGYPGY